MTHRIISHIIIPCIALIVFLMMPAFVHAACESASFAGGQGTEADPWQISTPDELANVSFCSGSENNDKHFIMTQDIDLNVAPYNTGTGWTPLPIFYGQFDGNNHTISNLFIDNPGVDNQGLFARVISPGFIENLVLQNISVSGGANVGGLVGYMFNDMSNIEITGTVEGTGPFVGGAIGRAAVINVTNVFVDVDVTSTVSSTPSGNIGGFIGTANGGLIDNVISEGSVTALSTGRAGGFMGSGSGNSNSFTITNSGSRGNVQADTNVGGFIGNMYAMTIENSFAEGNVTTNGAAGGFVGFMQSGGSISNSYASGDVTNTSSSRCAGFIPYAENSFGTPIVIENSYSIGNMTCGGSVSGFIDYASNVILTNIYSARTFLTSGFSDGGIIGSTSSRNVTTNNVYWDTDTSGVSTTYNNQGTGLTTAEMKDITNYTNWDFDTTWNRDASDAINAGYPYLRWQINSPQITSQSPVVNSTDISFDTPLSASITFSEAVGAESGFITLYRSDNDAVVEALDVAVSGIMGNGTNTLSFSFTTFLDEKTEYYILIDPTAIRSTSTGEFFAGIVDTSQWVFRTEDVTAPLVTQLSPANGATFTSLQPTLEMTFNEPVFFDNGIITVYEQGTNTEIVSIPVAGGIANTTVSVNFLDVLSPDTSYYVTVSPTAIVDEAGNNFAGISQSSVWSFTTRDTNAPRIISLQEGGRYNAFQFDMELFEDALTNSLELRFESVDDTIVIHLSDSPVGISTIPMIDFQDLGASPLVQGVTQNTLPDGTYTVTLAHRDTLDTVTLERAYENITIDTIAPSLVSSNPESGDLNVSLDGIISLTFDELVGWETNSLTIYRAADDSVFEVIPVGGGPVGGSGTATLFADPFNNFEPKTEYYVLIDANAIRDIAGNEYAGITDNQIIRFTTTEAPSRRRSSGGRVSAQFLQNAGITLSGDNGQAVPAQSTDRNTRIMELLTTLDKDSDGNITRAGFIQFIMGLIEILR